MGYSVSHTSIYYNTKLKTGSAVSHKTKTIYTMPNVTMREIIAITHELGHVIDFEKRKKRDRAKYIPRLIDEFVAWYYAIPIARKVKINWIDFAFEFYRCISTYILKGK